MAAAAAEFGELLIDALQGVQGRITPAYVSLDVPGGEAIKKEIVEDLDYFAGPVEFGVSLFEFSFIYSIS